VAALRPEASVSDELAIARKARDSAAEADDMRAENAKLVEQLDALRAQSSGLAEKPTPIAERKCYRCAAVYIDRKKRVVECQRCGSKLDPIDVLYEFCTKERNFLADNEHSKKELARIKAEIGALKGDAAKARVTRIECPRGCGKFVAVSHSHPHGVTPHACYEARADRHLVPHSAEERWRVLFTEGGKSRWTNLMTATRTATKTDGARVEEFTGPIGEKAERARDRAEHERQWRERIAARR
jgi:hypothetical protein